MLLSITSIIKLVAQLEHAGSKQSCGVCCTIGCGLEQFGTPDGNIPASQTEQLSYSQACRGRCMYPLQQINIKHPIPFKNLGRDRNEAG